MSLSGQQRKQLREAFIDAFPNKSSLEQMLSDQLDKNLDAIAGGGSLETVVFDLMKVADSQGWLLDLVCKASEYNPGNLRLKAIAEKLLINRATSDPSPKLPTQATLPQKILILAANPKDTTPLRLNEEVREIDAGLQRAKHRERFVLEQKWAVRPRDIQRAMLDIMPSIVHFSGHGMGDEGLVFEDETGQSKLVDGEALSGLFELFADRVECVVLNGCYSEVQASAIAQHVNYVIGMKKAVGDRAAIEFAVGFYDALGSGGSVEFAYKFGCAAMRLAGVSEQLTPIFKKKPKIDEMLVDPEYHNLKELLKAKNWGEADNVTSTIMRTKFGRDKNDALYKSDIKTFPCNDLNTIEQLWLKYSEKRFGFSKQEQIMSNIDATATEQQRKEDYPWKEFLNQVGWNGKVISEQNAPDGHFPAIGTWWRAYQPGWLEELFSRVRACQAGK